MRRWAAAPNERNMMTTDPATRPDVVLEQHAVQMPRYRVLLHNDDVNSMDHVIRALHRVFKFDAAVCERIMLEAHTNGVAVCMVEPLEPAELHRDQLISFSLVSTIEPE